ncbi:MAG: hypothetical protein CVU38_19995 [Chloroflexi bacterium HGW-Chloroflexi-1]|nr:MAG: hypothetical protein CVU38_19995 [Chloroflexi bacterium HGW-Chloroflexi-1]
MARIITPTCDPVEQRPPSPPTSGGANPTVGGPEGRQLPPTVGGPGGRQLPLTVGGPGGRQLPPTVGGPEGRQLPPTVGGPGGRQLPPTVGGPGGRQLPPTVGGPGGRAPTSPHSWGARGAPTSPTVGGPGGVLTRWLFRNATPSGQAPRSMHSLRLKFATHPHPLFCHELHEFSLRFSSCQFVQPVPSCLRASSERSRRIRGENSVLPRITRICTKVFHVNSYHSWREFFVSIRSEILLHHFDPERPCSCGLRPQPQATVPN